MTEGDDTTPETREDAAAEPWAGQGARTIPARAARRRRGPGIVMTLGILLIVTGLASLGWIAYQYLGTNGPSQEAAASEIDRLTDEWTNGTGGDVPEPGQPTAPTTGPGGAASPVPTTGATPQAGPASSQEQLDKAMAILRIPALGATYQVPVITGVSDYALARGVGWYPTTARPGQVGNFALAGHRVTHGEPFARLLELRKGDVIVVETKAYVYTYELDQEPGKLTVKDVDTWVLDPVPGKKGVTPTQSLITLTTCQDLFHSPDRSVGFGHLVDARKK